MSVSFGKIIVVNAPLRTAQEIALMANRRNKTKAGKQIQTIIDDSRFGRVHAFPADEKNEKSYLFSGSEGRKFGKMFAEALSRFDFAHNYYRDEKIKDSDINFSWRRLGEQVRELVDSSKNVSEMNVEYTNLGDVKSVNVIA